MLQHKDQPTSLSPLDFSSPYLGTTGATLLLLLDAQANWSSKLLFPSPTPQDACPILPIEDLPT